MALPSKDSITFESLAAHDIANTVWVRDDYLCMRAIAGPGELLDFLDHVAEVKVQGRLAGWKYVA